MEILNHGQNLPAKKFSVYTPVELAVAAIRLLDKSVNVMVLQLKNEARNEPSVESV